MADYVLPFIAQTDYPAFQNIIGELPPTYEGWQELHEAEKSNRERYQTGVREIPVDPNTFLEYCSRRGQNPSRHLLLLFAMEEDALPGTVNSDYDTLNGR